jgi:hypothetical protein
MYNQSRRGSIMGEIVYFIAAASTVPIAAPSAQQFLSASSSSYSQQQQPTSSGYQVQGRGKFKLKRLPETLWPDEIVEFDVGMLHSSVKFSSKKSSEYSTEVKFV